MFNGFIDRAITPALHRFPWVVLVIFSAICYSASSHGANYSVKSIVYDFEDISDTGEVLLKGCDDCGKAVNLGFEFSFYGRSYSQIYVSSNGFIVPGASLASSGDRSSCCDGRGIPFVDNLAGVMALWWTDLSMEKEKRSDVAEEEGKVFVERTGSPGAYVFIVQFNKVRHFHNLETNESNTFQLKLKQINNSIEFHYKNIVANNNIHTIGIESPRQNKGVKFFRTTLGTKLPPETKQFALRFKTPDPVKMTTSLRYGAEGNKLAHVFEVEELVNSIDDFEIVEDIQPASLASDIDFDNAALLSTYPAKFTLVYTLFNSLSVEKGGSVHGDYIDFTVNGGDFLTLDSQTVFIAQAKILEDDEAKISNVHMNENATLVAFKSEDNIAGISGKSANAFDVFFTGRDPDTFEAETHQLTRLESNQLCGAPYIDADAERGYLFVICETGDSVNEVALYRYNLDSYLDDDNNDKVKTISGTTHLFNGDIENSALVVARSGNIAYVRDNGVNQDIFLNGLQVNSISGMVKDLAIDDAGTKLVYVIGSSAYFYDSAVTTEVLIDNNAVTHVDIAGNGSLIVFNSNSDALDLNDNSDGSVEVFTVPAVQPLTGFMQKTDLNTAGICKLPRLSENGDRIVLVCNKDLLGLGNNFNSREGIFVIEEITGSTVHHLISSQSDKTDSISDLTLSADGANVTFQDANRENAFRLEGLSNISPSLESTGEKKYPVAFELPGSGNGVWLYMNIFIFVLACVRFCFYLRR